MTRVWLVEGKDSDGEWYSCWWAILYSRREGLAFIRNRRELSDFRPFRVTEYVPKKKRKRGKR